METVNLSSLMKLQPKQMEAMKTLLDPKCKYLLYGGSMAGGKSYFLRWGALAYSIFLYGKYHVEGLPVGLFSEDYPTLKDRQIARIEREFPKWIGELKDTKTDGMCFFLAPEYGSGKIMLRNLDDPSKYMSSEFAGIFVEELTRNPEQTFQDLRNRLRYPGIEDVKFVGATNPGGVGHGYVKKLFVDKISEDPEQDRFFYVQARVYDNKYVSETYIKQLESLPERKRKAYLEGSWDIFEGQFFTEFNNRLHTCKPFMPNNNLTFVGGMDWGRTAPFSFHLAALERVKMENGTVFHRVWTFLEVYGTEKTPREWAIIIKEKLKFFNLKPENIQQIMGDPAMFTKGNDNSTSIKDQFYKEGIVLKPASNDRIGGWTNMHDWLSIAPDGLPYWIITENCSNLIRTLPELVHDEIRIEDVDTEGEDHAPDDERYMLKALKWIDGRVGGVVHKEPSRRYMKAANINDDGQVSANLDKFAIDLKS